MTIREYLKKALALQMYLWPLTPVSTIYIISAILFCGSVSALAIKHIYSKPIYSLSSKVSNNYSNKTICVAGDSGCPNPNNTLVSVPSATTKATYTPTPLSTPAASSDPSNSVSHPSSSTAGNDCTDSTLTYTTTYQNVTWLPVGQTEAQGGMNGSALFCKGESPVIAKPINQIIYVGTGTVSSSSGQAQSTTSQGSISGNSGIPESQAAQQCDNNLANGADASDPQSYLDSCMQQYGY